MDTNREEALATAVIWVFGTITVALGLIVGAALIVGPLTGHWEPDIAAGLCLAVWLAVAAVTYTVYRIQLRRADHG